MNARTHIPEHILHRVLDRSRRRCALCFHFDNDRRQKEGQIAHLDRDPSNFAEDNLAFLCLPHHDDYDTKRRQTKNLTIPEAKTARDRLYAFIAEGGDLATASPQNFITRGTSQFFDRRYAIFDAARTFLIKLLQSANVSHQEIYTFIRKTSDTVFLLNDDLVTYFEDWEKRALRLLLISSTMPDLDSRTGFCHREWQKCWRLTKPGG